MRTITHPQRKILLDLCVDGAYIRDSRSGNPELHWPGKTFWLKNTIIPKKTLGCLIRDRMVEYGTRTFFNKTQVGYFISIKGRRAVGR